MKIVLKDAFINTLNASYNEYYLGLKDAFNIFINGSYN